MQVHVRKVEKHDVTWIRELFNQRWDADFVVSRGHKHVAQDLEGFIAEIDGEKVGLLTYKVINNELELTSIDSLLKNKGVGTVLIDELIKESKSMNIKRLWVITTNDNLNALKFYQKRGFRLKEIYPDGLAISRKLKPSIPFVGEQGIPLRDEIELEIIL